MTTSPIVDVVVGLVFFFLIMSLLCSVVQERVAQATTMRARLLERWIVGLLGTDAPRFYNHPLIAALGGTKASYIPSNTFAVALLDIFGIPPTSPAGAPDADRIKLEALVEAVRKRLADRASEPIRSALLAHFDHARGNVEGARASLERWFDQAMQRVSGVYKRQVQRWLIGIAAVVALLVNADTLRVARTLYQDPVVRAALAERAKTVSVQGAPSADSVATLVAGVPLPIGWPEPIPVGSTWLWFGIVKLVGLLLTIGAISLGAPFWFDLLNKIVNMRATGDRPAASRAANSTGVTIGSWGPEVTS